MTNINKFSLLLIIFVAGIIVMALGIILYATYLFCQRLKHTRAGEVKVIVIGG